MPNERAEAWTEEMLLERTRSEPRAPRTAGSELRLRERPSPSFEGEAERPAQASLPNDQGQKGRFRQRKRLIGLAILCFLMVAPAGYLYWDNAQHFETTDDAFIAARQYAIAPKVSGYLTSVPVSDNEHVAAGAVIARIDDRDYRLALAQADGQMAAARASIENINAQIAVQQAQVAQAEAQVSQSQAGLKFAQQQAARYQVLAHDGAGSVQDAQQYSYSISSSRRR